MGAYEFSPAAKTFDADGVDSSGVNSNSIDLLIEAAAVSGQIESGVSLQVLAQRSTLGAAGVNVLAQSHRGSRRGRAAKWTAAEDEFLKTYLGHLSVREIADALGRTVPAVNIRWKRERRLPAPSKDPTLYTSPQLAALLGTDPSLPADWMDAGVLPGGYDLPFEGQRRVRVISRRRFLMWLVNPDHWIYFDPRRVRDPYLKRLLDLKAERWGDEWWTPGQLARYHGISRFHMSLKVRTGVLENVRRWGNHKILKSVAVSARFCAGKGSVTPYVYSPAADAFLLLARAVGLTSNVIAALLGRHYGIERRKIARRRVRVRPLDPDMIQYRISQMRARPKDFYALLAEYRLRVIAGTDPQDLFADWKHYRARFPALARAMHKFQACLQGPGQNLTLAERRAVRGVFVRWSQYFLGSAAVVTRTGGASIQSLRRVYWNLVERGVDPFKEGYMNISIRTETFVNLELTQAQAEAVVKDPSHLQRELRAALHTVGSSGGTPKQQRKPQKKATCPECQRSIAPHWLERHRASKHGVTGKVAAKKNGHLQHEPVTAQGVS